MYALVVVSVWPVLEFAIYVSVFSIKFRIHFHKIRTIGNCFLVVVAFSWKLVCEFERELHGCEKMVVRRADVSSVAGVFAAALCGPSVLHKTHTKHRVLNSIKWEIE